MRIAMKLQHIHIITISLAMLLIAGCTTPFTAEQRESVLPVIFEVLQPNVSEYEGQTVMFGGEIIETTNRENETEIVILQKPTDSRGWPLNEDESAGRFIFIAPRYLDPQVYSQGRKITVIGTVIGAEQRMIGELEYDYPVLEEVDHYLWKPYETGPKVHIGFGVGFRFPNE